MLYVWLTALALSLVIEFCYTKVIFFWFSLGAFVASFLAGFNLAWYYQLGSFAVVSGLSIWLLRNPTLLILETNSKRKLAISVLGKEFTLLTPIKLNLA